MIARLNCSKRWSWRLPTARQCAAETCWITSRFLLSPPLLFRNSNCLSEPTAFSLHILIHSLPSIILFFSLVLLLWISIQTTWAAYVCGLVMCDPVADQPYSVKNTTTIRLPSAKQKVVWCGQGTRGAANHSVAIVCCESLVVTHVKYSAVLVSKLNWSASEGKLISNFMCKMGNVKWKLLWT